MQDTIFGMYLPTACRVRASGSGAGDELRTTKHPDSSALPSFPERSRSCSQRHSGRCISPLAPGLSPTRRPTPACCRCLNTPQLCMLPVQPSSLHNGASLPRRCVSALRRYLPLLLFRGVCSHGYQHEVHRICAMHECRNAGQVPYELCTALMLDWAAPIMRY